jgi:hypothetical protein
VLGCILTEMSVKLAMLLAKKHNQMYPMKLSNVRTSPGCQMFLGKSRLTSTLSRLWSTFEVGEAANNGLLIAGDSRSESITHRRVYIRRHASYITSDIFERNQTFRITKSLGSIRRFISSASTESLDENITDATSKNNEQDVQSNGWSEQLNRRKTYYRAKQLCSILKKKQEAIYKEFTLKHRKRFYTLQDGVFYEFPSSKEIIIDEDAILKSKNERNKMLLRKSRKEVKREVFTNKNLERTPVIVILGHFNHGKTTLLDALGSFTIVNKEAHGITQVCTC